MKTSMRWNRPGAAALVCVVGMTGLTASDMAFAGKEKKGPASIQCEVPLNALRRHFRAPRELRFEMPGLRIASVQDPTHSTGATLFYFDRGARVQVDVRGGSAVSSEATLFEAGSYSNEIDGIVFAGGSSMGISAGEGVKSVIFEERAERAGSFDFIPSVPTSVVYDFGYRAAPFNEEFTYPTHEMGRQLKAQLQSGRFQIGRVGAGVNTTVNKIRTPRWGGQGAAYASYPWGKIFVAVVLNPVGDIVIDGQRITERFRPVPGAEAPFEIGDLNDDLPTLPEPGKNTTLSLIVTDVPLDRNQLKRLSIGIHTNMAQYIQPFHTYTDGDINYAVSMRRGGAPEMIARYGDDEGAFGGRESSAAVADLATEGSLLLRGIDLMKEAVQAAIEASNTQARR